MSTPHKFQRVFENKLIAPASRVSCWSCEQYFWTNQMWADLNGESFRAYYCTPCKEETEKWEKGK